MSQLLIWVVDSADPQRLEESQKELHKFVSLWTFQGGVTGICQPILVLGKHLINGCTVLKTVSKQNGQI